MINVPISNHSDKPMRAFFLDSENGAARLLEGMELLTRSDSVVVFHRGSFPFELKNKLEFAPCAVEWVKCVDPGVKNSMDVQIIAEMAMRLALGGFKNAYILSEDKGYLPAVHYLQQTQQEKGCDIALVKSVTHASLRTVLSTLTALKGVDSVEDIENALAPLFGEYETRDIVGEFKRVFAKTLNNAGSLAGGATVSLNVSVEGIEQRGDASIEPVTEDSSFIGLPGIGKMLASKLEGAGVANPAELSRIGAVEAWIGIYRTDTSFPPKWVYSFEAAIEGVPVHAIDAETKKRLKGEVKAFLTRKDRAA